jgi:rSAM/selenodomain-associated transferase 1
MRSALIRRTWPDAMTAESSRDTGPPLLLIFARDPVPGQVKTRLAASLGADAAAAVYRELVDETISYALAARTLGVVDAVEIWCTPDAGSSYFQALGTRDGVSLRRQGEGNLGDRMAMALGDVLARSSSALLIGTDCPALGVAGVSAAAALLRDHDAVLGPAEDGGFVLVGARVPLGFDGVRWSTSQTLHDTRTAFARAKLQWGELPMSWDVDLPADVLRWQALAQER